MLLAVVPLAIPLGTVLGGQLWEADSSASGDASIDVKADPGREKPVGRFKVNFHDGRSVSLPAFKEGDDSVVVKGPFVGNGKAAIDWINSYVKGEGALQRVDMTLSLKKGDLGGVRFAGCINITYSPPSVSSGNYDMLEETLTFHVERIEKTHPPGEEPSHPFRGCILRFDDRTVPKTGRGHTEPGPGASPDDVIFGNRFEVEIEGANTSVTSLSGGGVTFDLKEASGGSRRGKLREYTVTNVTWKNVVLERPYMKGVREWEDWSKKMASGEPEHKNATARHLDDKDNEIRVSTYYECFPIRWETAEVTSDDGSII